MTSCSGTVGPSKRAKAEELRSPMKTRGLAAQPACIKDSIFTFLQVQDLCALSECNADLNARIQTSIPKIWQKLGKTFSLPETYWPKADFSKKRCVENLGLVHSANETLKNYTDISHPFYARLESWSSNLKQKLPSNLLDPQERFVQYTQPFVKQAEAAGATFSRLARNLHLSPESPHRLFNLLWTCGQPLDGRILKSFAQSMRRLMPNQREDNNLMERWIVTLNWLTKNTKATEQAFEGLIEAYAAAPLAKKPKIEALALQPLQSGLVLSAHTLHLALSPECRVPLTLLFPMLRAIRTEAHEIPIYLAEVLDACFNQNGYILNHPPGTIVALLRHFKSPDPDDYSPWWLDFPERFVSTLSEESVQPLWFYAAAKTQNAELLSLLCEMGIRSSASNNNSLTLALKDKAPVEVIGLMLRHGAQPFQETLDLINSYTQDSIHRTALRQLLGEPYPTPPSSQE